MKPSLIFPLVAAGAEQAITPKPCAGPGKPNRFATQDLQNAIMARLK